MQVITLKNNEKFIIGSDRDIENVVVDFCGEEFATELMDYINDLKDQADYETLKFNSDMGVYEGEMKRLEPYYMTLKVYCNSMNMDLNVIKSRSPVSVFLSCLRKYTG